MVSWKRLPVLVPVLLVGCAHGFDHHALQERLNDPALQSPDAAISEARGLRPQLRFPCRVAVYLRPSSDRDWRWTPEDRAAMELWAAALKSDGIAADVFVLPEVLIARGENKNDVKELRLAAAKCGADALYVVHGAAQTDSYKNFAAVFNVTLVGGYVVPASHKDTLFLMEGVLLDVDNGYVYTGVQAEGVGKIMRPTFVIEEKDAIAIAKAKAVAQFGEETVKRMRVLATTPVRVSDVPAVKPTPAPDKPGRAVIDGADALGDRATPVKIGPGSLVPRPLVSDINNKGVTAGLTPAGTFAPDIDVPIRPTGTSAGGVMTGITAPRPDP